MLSAPIDTYCIHLKAEGKSPKTTDWHRASLTEFDRWLAAASCAALAAIAVASAIDTFASAVRLVCAYDTAVTAKARKAITTAARAIQSVTTKVSPTLQWSLGLSLLEFVLLLEHVLKNIDVLIIRREPINLALP